MYTRLSRYVVKICQLSVQPPMSARLQRTDYGTWNVKIIAQIADQRQTTVGIIVRTSGVRLRSACSKLEIGERS